MNCPKCGHQFDPPSDAVSQSFNSFWVRWCKITGRVQRKAYACQAWVGAVTFETEARAMECLERYGRSRDVAQGAIASPDKWIYDQARDGFAGDWQAANGKQARVRGPVEVVIPKCAICGDTGLVLKPDAAPPTGFGDIGESYEPCECRGKAVSV